MEASRFGFGADMPPVFKFEPSDADIVAHYLLPRALNLPSTYAHAVIDDDPSSLSPRELLRRHGHGSSDHAFFFSGQPPPAPAATTAGSSSRKKKRNNGGRKERTLRDGSGTWRGQKRVEERLTLLRPGRCGEVDVRYKRYNLTFYRAGETESTSGWVMYEYEITSPPLPGTVLTRVKVTDKGKKDMQQAAEAEALAAAADQPSYLPAVMTSAGEASTSGGQTYGFYGDNGGGMVEPGSYNTPPVYVPDGGGAGEGSSSGGQTYGFYGDNGGGMAETGAYNTPPVYVPDGGGAGEGFSSGGQTYGFYGDNGGGMTEPGAYYTPPVYVLDGAGAGEYSNNYGQHQQVLPWPADHQLDPSYQHHAAGNAAVVGDGEGCSGWQQTSAPDAAHGGGIEENYFASILHALEAGGDCAELFVDGDVKQELDYA